jgi:MinD-like ATPase involved in chromosome partitioning or flagellar assembly
MPEIEYPEGVVKMSLTSSVPPTTELAQSVLQRLTNRYPDLEADIASAPRLLSALDAVTRTTDLSAEQIYDGLTARELASAQRPIGVLISRCTELIDNAAQATEDTTQSDSTTQPNTTQPNTTQADTTQARNAVQTDKAAQAPNAAQSHNALQTHTTEPTSKTEQNSNTRRTDTTTQARNAERTVEPAYAPTNGTVIGATTLRTATRETHTIDTYAYQLPDDASVAVDSVSTVITGGNGAFDRSTTRAGSVTFVPELAKLPKTVIPRYGFPHALYRMSGGLIHLRPGRRERTETELFSRIASPVSGTSNVIILGLKGGVGKTTVCLGLGHTFAAFRNDRVIAIDASSDPGTLGQRVGDVRGASVRELIHQRGRITSYSDVRSFAVQQPSGLEILSSDDSPLGAGPLTTLEYQSAIDCLCAYFNLIITDSGAGVSLPSLHGLLGPATQLVLVTAPMVDAGWSTAVLLDWLEQEGYESLVANATIVVNHVQRRVDVKTNDFDRYFLSRCRSLIHIPWDANLAAGGKVSVEHLHRDARLAYRTLAATIAESFANSTTVSPPWEAQTAV